MQLTLFTIITGISDLPAIQIMKQGLFNIYFLRPFSQSISQLSTLTQLFLAFPPTTWLALLLCSAVVSPFASVSANESPMSPFFSKSSQFLPLCLSFIFPLPLPLPLSWKFCPPLSAHVLAIKSLLQSNIYNS